MDEITKKLLDYIKQYRNDNGVGPSLDEMAAAVGMTKPGVAYRLNVMAEAGLVKRGPQSRSIQVVAQ